MIKNNKQLGQHWLKDSATLNNIANLADLSANDVVLEIGPGLGTLTSHLLARAKKVVAVEFDAALAKKLPAQFPGKNLEVIHQDILQFNNSELPTDYKIVANVPYYITSKIVQKFSETDNPPKIMVLLVQKEVAERLAAQAGDYSVLGIAAQVFYEVSLGDIVPSDLFTPPPKVDSQVVVLKRRSEPLIPVDRQKLFFRLIKAGFSAKRKKLRSSLAGGLGVSKTQVEQWLGQAEISPDLRAEDLTVDDWRKIMEKVQ